jgi:hypothetical protein
MGIVLFYVIQYSLERALGYGERLRVCKFTTIAFATSYNYSPINNQSILLSVFMNV